ncbi:unnamed protein product [Zymoseptoria tritici ST99CH_1A5]|uniref:F-box domain-containing protein n=1 Tax=Zymoseptoria tritici ST99CH_1A5 TaxID=1276529 RepID=A0A1Y6LI50_ZYMTR|nr:unnamed protein product [Zymoseptoria tritici ST99CH_1A5]
MPKQEFSPGIHYQNIATLSVPTVGISATAAEDFAEPLTTNTEMQPADFELATSTPLPPLTTIDCTEAQPFRLLDLPDELWIKIGKMVIEDLPVTQITMKTAFDYTTRAYNIPEHFKMPKVLAAGVKTPAILHTCSSLRKELRLGYYNSKINILVEFFNGKEDKWVPKYLRAIGTEARKQISGAVDMGCLNPIEPTPNFPYHRLEHWQIEMKLTPRRGPSECTFNSGCEKFRWIVEFL